MSNQKNNTCLQVQQYFDGELPEKEKARFEKHLADCEQCRHVLRSLSQVSELMVQASDQELSDSADLRIRRALSAEMTKTFLTQPEEILDLEGVASVLKLPLSELPDILDQLPSFELCGRLRFRRSKILEWVEQRERTHDWEKSMSRQDEKKVIKFSGEK